MASRGNEVDTQPCVSHEPSKETEALRRSAGCGQYSPPVRRSSGGLRQLVASRHVHATRLVACAPMLAIARPLVPALGLLALLIAGCDGGASGRRSLVLAECRLPRLPVAAQCGTLVVPENRSKPDGRKISLFVAVLPANTLSPKPDPLFILAGGPGQAASHLGPFAAHLNEVRRTRDIVLIDQRGTGRSSPLDCVALKPDEDLRSALEIDPLPRARACALEFTRHDIDASQYTTTNWIADLEAVRAALGYDRVNLWGGSYGTRVAQEYLRRHPERIRSVVLDGVAPPRMTISLDVWPSRERALENVLAACAASEPCRKTHPDLAATLGRIGRSLGSAGRDVTVTDPRTGATVRMRMTFPAFLAGLQPLVYAPELAALLPEILDRADAGDFGPLFATVTLAIGDLSEQMNPALHYSVTCAEDVPRISPASRELALKEVRSRELVRNLLAVCDVWPRGTMPPDFAAPVRSDTPVLLLSGGSDPVTLPAYADEVAKTLPNSRHIVATGYGHIVSPHACAPRLIAAFIDRAGFDRLPVSCVEYLGKSKSPPLWPDRLEARP